MLLAIILARDDVGLAQGSGCGGGEKWSDSVDVLEVKALRGIADGLHMGFETKKIRIIPLHGLSN